MPHRPNATQPYILDVLNLLEWATGNDDFTVYDVMRNGPPGWRGQKIRCLQPRLRRLAEMGVLESSKLRPVKTSGVKKLYRTYKGVYRIGDPYGEELRLD